MYAYTWYQWLLIFYFYCFFGWVFESAYVSAQKRRFVNRGFLRLPLLPLYGTGAVMMLWISLPFTDRPVLVFLLGMAGATALEYVTGWAMERLFKIKYWDYSGQRFQFQGYICLSSSLAWGCLTLLLTRFLHRPVSQLVTAVPPFAAAFSSLLISGLFIGDAAQSIRAALNLAKILEAMTRLQGELDELQVQMALLKSEASQRLELAKDNTALRLALWQAEAAARRARLGLKPPAKPMDAAARHMESLAEDAALRVEGFVENTASRVAQTAGKLSSLTEEAAGAVASGLLRRQQAAEADRKPEPLSPGERELARRLSSLSKRLEGLAKRQKELAGHMGFYSRGILKGNPSATSRRFENALRELRELAFDKTHKTSGEK